MSPPRTLMTGIALGESPRWHDGRLWFADWGTREIIALDLDGASEVVLRGPDFPLCFDWLPDGRMLVVSASDGLLLRREPGGELVTHADLSGIDDHRWNDIVVDARGNAYVGNVGFDFPGGEFAPGVLALATPDGSVRQVADGVAFPNGLAVLPDGKALIVAESYGNRLTAFDIAADGGLSNRRVWADLPGGYPDGICADSEDAVWYADVPNRRCVRVREGGEILQTVQADRGCFACALGGPDRRTLLIVAAEWGGELFAGPPTGVVLAAPAPAAGAGRP